MPHKNVERIMTPGGPDGREYVMVYTNLDGTIESVEHGQTGQELRRYAGKPDRFGNRPAGKSTKS
jgi:hypothetical protein